MAANYPNYAVPATWTDLYAVSGYTALANQLVTVQSVGRDSLQVYFGGSSAPADNAQGNTLMGLRSVSGTTDHLWVRSSGSAILAVLQED